MPRKDLINKYIQIVTPMFKVIDNLSIENDKLIKQRDLLLPRLMSWKLEVK